MDINKQHSINSIINTNDNNYNCRFNVWIDNIKETNEKL